MCTEKNSELLLKCEVVTLKLKYKKMTSFLPVLHESHVRDCCITACVTDNFEK